MNYVLLDTSVLVNCALVNAAGADPELLSAISKKMREKGLKLLLPAAVELEFARKIPEELALIKQQTKKFRDAITTQALPAPDVSRLHETLDQLDAQRDAAANKAREYFADLAADVGLTIHIPLDGAIIAEAIGYVLEGRKPSKGPSRGLLDPDSLIVASVANFARCQGLSSEDAILICSDNHTDFGTWDSETNTHVVAAGIAEALPCAVRYYKSPRALVEHELCVDVEEGGALAQALDEYDDYRETIAAVAAASEPPRIGPLRLGELIGRQMLLENGSWIIGPGLVSSPFKSFDALEGGTLVPGCTVSIAGGGTYTFWPDVEMQHRDDKAAPTVHD